MNNSALCFWTVFNPVVNELIMNKSSEINEDPNGAFCNADFHM